MPDNTLANLEIVFCDDSFLVVNKPAGLLAVPGRVENDCLSSRIQQVYPDALVVHRLDMATSGLLVFARSQAMQRRLSAMFHDREIEKQYIAVVSGFLPDIEGEINLPLSADWPNRPRQKVDIDNGKPSLTRYQRLSYCEPSNTCRVSLTPITGRTHQLRVHLLAIGHPIIGDVLYGGEKADRLMLHAQMLQFKHPLRGEQLDYICEAKF